MTNTQMKKLARGEYLEKQALCSQKGQYYFEQTTKYGLKSLEKIRAYLPDEYQFLQLRRNIVFSHLDMEKILELISQKKEFNVVSGLNPSSPLHLGHKGIFDVLLSLQKLGARVFIPLTNDETYADGKTDSLASSRLMAYEEIIPSIIAFGFDPAKTHIFVDSDYPDIYNFGMHISRHIQDKKVESVFGKDSIQNGAQSFYRSGVQLAEILLPQLAEFGGPQPVLIPVGIDQHPYLLMSRDVAKELKLIQPSELVMKFQQSLRDPLAKMSGSKPETAIFLSDSSEVIKNKISKAYTGAVGSLEDHKKLGGIPEICSVFSLLYSQHPDDAYVETFREKYISGEIKMSELKEVTTKFISQLVVDHQRRRSKVSKKQINNFLLKKPLRSFLEY